MFVLLDCFSVCFFFLLCLTFRFAFKNVSFYTYSPLVNFDRFSSRGLAAPKMVAACLVSATALIGSVTVRGFNTSLGRSDSSAIDEKNKVLFRGLKKFQSKI